MLDSRGEKAGLMGRIFKAKKNWKTLQELIMNQEEEMKVLEINDNKISKKKDKEEKKVDLKEIYKIKEQENQAKLYTIKYKMVFKEISFIKK